MKCEHSVCTCVVAESIDVCSVHCRDAVEEVGDASMHRLCECGHPDCDGTADLESVLDEESLHPRAGGSGG